MDIRTVQAGLVQRPVFKRFALLSDDDKAKVVEKVKEKMNGGNSEDTSDESAEEPAEDTGEEAPAEDAEESPDEENSTEESDKDGDNQEAERVLSEVEDQAIKVNLSTSLGSLTPEEFEAIENESGEGDEALDQEVEVPDEVAEPNGEEAPEQDLAAIVDGIAEEIEQIKSDGQVTPGEVMGLMDNMMTMVNELLRAKPGRAKKATDARIERIATRIVAEYREAAIAMRVAAVFNTQDELDAYLKTLKNPEKARKHHTVKAPGKKDAPAEGEKPAEDEKPADGKPAEKEQSPREKEKQEVDRLRKQVDMLSKQHGVIFNVEQKQRADAAQEQLAAAEKRLSETPMSKEEATSAMESAASKLSALKNKPMPSNAFMRDARHKAISMASSAYAAAKSDRIKADPEFAREEQGKLQRRLESLKNKPEPRDWKMKQSRQTAVRGLTKQLKDIEQYV